MTTILRALAPAGTTNLGATTSADAPKAEDESFFQRHKTAIIIGAVGAAALAVGGVLLLRHRGAQAAAAEAAAIEAARLTPDQHATKAVEALDRAAAEFTKLRPATFEEKVARSSYPALTPQSNEAMWRNVDLFHPSAEYSGALGDARLHTSGLIDEIVKRNPALTTTSEQAYNTWKTKGSAIGSIIRGEPIQYETTTKTIRQIPRELAELRANAAVWLDQSVPYSYGLVSDPMATGITPLRDAILALDLAKYAPAAVNAAT